MSVFPRKAQMRCLFSSGILFLGLLVITSRDAAAARIKVALLDGEPVYHWTNFPSLYRNDIDR